MAVSPLFMCFFFQAEDGIRDLVRSRGLGDVYKRQAVGRVVKAGRTLGVADVEVRTDDGRLIAVGRSKPVSYTHLTLPTSDLV